MASVSTTPATGPGASGRAGGGPSGDTSVVRRSGNRAQSGDHSRLRRPAPLPRTGYRPDVQGLRALAVALVVGYHLYPDAIGGGYVGVDVFFVISGFLITGHLTRRLMDTGRVQLLEFYGRRARRLLPAAIGVLLVTWVASRWLLPVTQLPEAARQIRASALYVQNWALAADSVDYLTQDQAPSPVQHYWSLSVEEQFYLLWPLVFVVAAVGIVALRRHGVSVSGARTRGVTIAAAGAVIIVAGSLWYSIHATDANPAAAYFVTPTRLWELGLGGLLSLWYPAISRRIGRLGGLSWLGLAMVLGSAFVLSGESAFPGWIAIVPTMGAAIMIGSGSSAAAHGVGTLLARRPMVFLGDISYSIYLWHWPLIVLYLSYSGGTIGILDGPVLAVASVVLAWLSKIWVEDPFRTARWIAPHPRRSLATVVLAVLPLAVTTPAVSTLISTRDNFAGTRPPLEQAPTDFPLANLPKCKAEMDESEVVSCTRGDTSDPAMTIALVGDSYAGEWSSALIALAPQNDWRIVTVTHDSCPWTAQMLSRDGNAYTECHDWGEKALDYLLDDVHPDVVIASEHPERTIPGHDELDSAARHAIADGMVEYWTKLAEAGTFVIGIHPTPDPKIHIPDCLSSRTGSIDSCSVPRPDAIEKTTAIGLAVKALGPSHAALIDLNDHICGATECRPILHDMIVYRDEEHLTKTFSMSLAPELNRELQAVVPRAEHTQK